MSRETSFVAVEVRETPVLGRPADGGSWADAAARLLTAKSG
jgi:hypothetical protein